MPLEFAKPGNRADRRKARRDPAALGVRWSRPKRPESGLRATQVTVNVPPKDGVGPTEKIVRVIPTGDMMAGIAKVQEEFPVNKGFQVKTLNLGPTANLDRLLEDALGKPKKGAG
jgi:hypothetical protein